MKKGTMALGVVFLLLIFVLGTATYTVGEDEVVVVRNLSTISKVYVKDESSIEKVKADLAKKNVQCEVVFAKGLQFKIPFIQKIEKYSSKLITYTSNTETINTNDKRQIDINIASQYKVVNPGLVSLKLGMIGYERRLNNLVDDKMYPLVINTVNSLGFIDFFDIEKVKPALQKQTQVFNDTLASEYGIEIVDTMIYKKMPPVENQAAIISKMVAEIAKKSDEITAQGQSEYDEEVAIVNKEAKILRDEATKLGAEVRASADKEALQIIRKATQVDLSFYTFINRVMLLKEIKDTTIFLDKNTNLFDPMQ